MTSTTDPAQDERLINRTVWHVMPLVALCMAVCTIDRSNIGFAKLTMAKDLGMSEAAFALGSSLFYVGYLLFEVPSGMAAHRYGARKWTARIMASWGVATILLAFTQSITMFYVLRFLLGVAEAGLYPALVYYISLWAPKHTHARSLGFLTIGSALGNGLGALIAGPLLDINGVGGLAGWQWIFLITGLFPLLTTILVLTAMRDGPRDARFLDEAERARLSGLIERDAAAAADAGSIFSALVNLRVIGFGIAYATILTALYGVIYWAPSIVSSFHVSGTLNGLLVAAPWAVDIVLLLMIPRNLGPRALALALVAVCALGVATFAWSSVAHAGPLRYVTLFIGIPCISLAIAFFWTFPMRLFHGVRSAGAIAAISTLGNFGGLLGQNMMPAVAKAGGGVSAALWVPCVCLGAVLVGSLVALKRRPASQARTGSVR